jgi:hypothetical protein
MIEQTRVVRFFSEHRLERCPSYGIAIGLIIIGVLISGCSHGLAPPSAPQMQSGFGGTVYFTSPWPDSVYDIRIVAFYDYPPRNIVNEILSGQAKVYPPINGTPFQLPVDSVTYLFSLDSASTFQYVAVAMRFGQNLYTDWKVVGAYGYSHGVGSPKSVVVPEGVFVNGINIYVDFQNSPPTPIVGSEKLN